ncbi:hypothetical protein Acr_00g0063990 [Actinidia rufa]|uniref:Helicase MOV-10-like beta-barrel domain-containing protein n=1 Tax=Actinidia rufa TaxID=165716 RepID=A0A7J0DPE8_9ERIC|nr:hypothetical protein Acr_00g0063990 [Actinidia rufa]
MSVFLEILRCILCFDDEESETRGRNRRDTSFEPLFCLSLAALPAASAAPAPACAAASSSHAIQSNTYAAPTQRSSTVQQFLRSPAAQSSRQFLRTDPSHGRSEELRPSLPDLKKTDRSLKDRGEEIPEFGEDAGRGTGACDPLSDGGGESRIGSGRGCAEPSSITRSEAVPGKDEEPEKNGTVSKKVTSNECVLGLEILFLCPPESRTVHKNPSVAIKPETGIRTPHKSLEGTQKPNILPPSPSPNPTQCYQHKAINSTNQRLPQPSPSLSKPSSLSKTPPPSVPSLSSSSSKTPPSFPKPLQTSTKPTLCLAPSTPTKKMLCLEFLKSLCPLQHTRISLMPCFLPRTSTLRNGMDFKMENVTLELHEAAIYKRKGKYNNLNVNDEKDDKVFAAFEIDSIPERRPFLLSRDFVSVQPSGKKAELFQGLIYRVVKSNLVLVEFGEDFHYQHYSACKYDIKFSFNRVCLKRAHQAISAATDPLFRSFLFPDCKPENSLVAALVEFINPKLDPAQISAVRRILCHKTPPPYLVEGPISVNKSKQLSRTGSVVCEAVFQIYQISPSSRILICAPINSTCDVITRILKNLIPESDMFRANAAFRELDGVPVDILPTCLFKRECFSCPSMQELRNFRVILSTLMSSFRLHGEGIMAGHFSHIFLVDATSATEPEIMVALANLANERTTVVMTGDPRNHTGWIRSNIARQNGLMISYFERLRKSKLYMSLDSKVITKLED